MDVMAKVVSLCKRRGFVFQSSEIYGGLKSFYDYGPLGLELKKNIASLWWDYMVDRRDDVVGLDSSVVMHPKVWQASGHLDNFTDPLVDCKNCKARFRADKQPRVPKVEVPWHIKDKTLKNYGEKVVSVPERGYVCPECGSTDLSEERPFCGLFRTFVGAIDPLAHESAEGDSEQILSILNEHSVYLRPETAQAMFVQFLNVQKSMGMKVPFGIAQHGKSFRNEIVVEHFIFRSCEFEQMEMEYFCEPGTEAQWLEYWCDKRLNWYHKLACHPRNFRLRSHHSHELAHYSDACFDVEYQYPWGWDELEGIASRGDYDLAAHAAASGAKLSYFDQQKPDPKTGKLGWRYVPKVIEPAAGLTRAFLCFLLDAYTEDSSDTGTKEPGSKRTYLNLHPLLAPYKVAILPLVKESGQLVLAANMARDWRDAGIKLSVDTQKSIGKRYARHDEIGTPYAVTIDHDSLTDQKVTLRERNSKSQQRLTVAEAKESILRSLRAPWNH